jgi:hypothetical protein
MWVLKKYQPASRPLDKNKAQQPLALTIYVTT